MHTILFCIGLQCFEYINVVVDLIIGLSSNLYHGKVVGGTVIF